MRARTVRWVAGALPLTTGGVAAAGPLIISPTTVDIQPGRRSAAVEVLNDSDEPTDLQFRAYDWAQADGQDRLTPIRELIVSPAITTVAPHAKQVFWVLEMSTAAVTGERSYRLRLNQIPRGGAGAVRINLEFSLPVFHSPPDAAPDLAWSPRANGIELVNRGTRRVKLGRLALRRADGFAVALNGAASVYLLAGSRRHFALAAPVSGAHLVGAADTGAIYVQPSTPAAR